MIRDGYRINKFPRHGGGTRVVIHETNGYGQDRLEFDTEADADAYIDWFLDNMPDDYFRGRRVQDGAQ